MSSLKYSIIPKPQQYKTLDATYTVTTETAVLCVPEFIKAGKYLSEFLKTKKDAKDGAVKFNKDASLKAESYRLRVDNSGIVITAADERGAFYGAVTLKIMIMQSKQGSGKAVISGADIYDYPKYSYRSGMLDVSRHFFGVDVVKRLLDSMALLKLNKFHWHLSDDQGFRIESEKFPLLNEKGSRRAHEYLDSDGYLNNHITHGGDEYFHYYTKAEIREIVEYAGSLCIDVIPEIDMPGHTVAFLAAYNNLSCLKGEYETHGMNGITRDILCAGQEETYDFIKELLTEVTALFPYEYFHVGGDEAGKGHKIWENECPVCKKAIEENGLKSGAELQEYFSNRVNKILNDLGKTSIEWNDGFGDKTDGNIVCQYWTFRGPAWLAKEGKRRKFIISPDPYYYFDETYARTSLKRAYNFAPVKVGYTGPKENILGIEFETWTEWITDEEALQFAIYPRIFALAENAWTEDKFCRYKDFYKRLEFFKGYMRSKEINYSRLEKKKFGIKNPSVYHLGNMGVEYKYNEKLKEAEK